jgi:hypothetical protein
MLGQMQTAAARPAAAPPPQDVSGAEEELTPPEDLGPSLAEVEGLAGQLSAALSRIESEARDQSMQVTQALAARLFPALVPTFSGSGDRSTSSAAHSRIRAVYSRSVHGRKCWSKLEPHHRDGIHHFRSAVK